LGTTQNFRDEKLTTAGLRISVSNSADDLTIKSFLPKAENKNRRVNRSQHRGTHDQSEQRRV
jgi:hypothetical protein